MAGASASGIRAGRAFVEISADMSKLDAGLRRAQQKVAAFGEGIKAVGMAMAQVGVGIGAPLAIGAKLFSDFENNMVRAEAILSERGELATGFKAMRAEAMRLGADTVFSAGEAAKAMAIFAAAGFDSGASMKAAAATLDLAAASQLGLAESADIVGKLMSSQSLATRDLSTVVDMLAKAATSANTNVMDLGEAFKHVSPTARGLGVSLAETMAAVTLLQGAGHVGEMAGTGLRGFILEFMTPSDKARAAMQALGVEIKKTAAGGIDLAATLELLESKLPTTPLDRGIKVGEIFPSNKTFNSAMSLLGIGAAKLRTLTGQLDTSGGTASRIAARQLDTLSGSLELLKSSLEGLGITIGAAVAPVFRSWGTVLVGLTNSIDALSAKNPELYARMAKVAGGALGLGAGLLALGTTVKLTSFSLGWMATGVGLVGKVLTFALTPLAMFKTSLAGLVAMKGAIAGTLGALSLSSLAGPLGVVAIAGITAKLVTMHDVAGKVANGIGTAFSSAAQTATLAWSGIQDALSISSLPDAWNVALAGLNLEWIKVVGMMKETWGGFTDWLTKDSLKDVFGIITAELGRGRPVTQGDQAGLNAFNQFGMLGSGLGVLSLMFGQGVSDSPAVNPQAANMTGDPWAAGQQVIDAALAQQEFDQALENVGLKKLWKESLSGLPGLGEFFLNRYTGSGKPLPPNAEQLAQSLGKGESHGTFLGGIAGLLGGTSVTEQIKEELKGQTKVLNDIRQNTGEGGRFS